MSVRLEACGVSVHHGRRAALEGVDLRVRAGEMVGVLGANGAGKSTLVRVLAGLDAPTSGTVTLDDRPIASYSARARARRVGVVLQDPTVAFPFTVLEVVLLGRLPHLGAAAFAGPTDLAVAEAALATLEIAHLRDRPIGALSGGERQRAFLARALAQSSLVLLLDEPTTHLDLRHQTGIVSVIAGRCREEGLAAVVVLHDVNLAAAWCDRVLVLAEGRGYASGAPADVFTPETLARAFGVEAQVKVDGGPGVTVRVVGPAGRRRDEL